MKKGRSDGSPTGGRPDLMVQSEIHRLKQENEQLKISQASTSDYLKGLSPNLEKLRVDVRRTAEETTRLKETLAQEKSNNATLKAEVKASVVRMPVFPPPYPTE